MEKVISPTGAAAIYVRSTSNGKTRDPATWASSIKMAPSVEEELWRRAEARREAELYADMAPADRALLPLILSLARLAAQRDAKAAR